MSAYPNLRSEPVSVEQFVRKIVLLCDRHDVAWGTPENLAEFMRAVKDNKHLAMDFWAVVALMSAETGVVGPEPHRLLEVIVEGVTGRTVAEVIGAGSAQRQAIDELARLLAGEDIWSPVKKGTKKDENGGKGPAITTRSGGGDKGLTKEPARATSGVGSTRRGADGSVSEATGGLPVVSVPRLDAPAQHASLPAPPPINSSAPEAGTRQDAPYADRGDAPPRIFLEPEPWRAEPEAVRSEGEPFHIASEPRYAEPPFVDREAFRRGRWRGDAESPEDAPHLVCVDDPLIRIPLSEYSETSKSRRGLVAGVVLLAIVGVGAFAALLARGGGGELGQRLHLGISTVSDRIAQNSIIQSLHDRVMGGNQPTSVKTTSAVSSGEMNSPAATGGSQESVANEPPAVGESSGAAAPAASNAGASGAGEAVKDGSNRSVSPQIEQEKASTRQRGEEAMDAGAGGAVQVPAEVMTSHLISSRVPVYPEEAKVHHSEGPVVMQAVITKSGWVGHLHVLSGDPILRAAAVAAVTTWRYRPYTQNGEPVDVSTTISVEFPAEW